MGTWQRCPDCFRKASSLAFIKTALRGTLDTVPKEIEALPALPFADASVIHPNDVFFRQWAWRSLLDYETRDLVYDYLDATRLVEANFNRDPDYNTLLPLQQLPLLIVDLSVTRRDHPYLGPVFMEVVIVRQRNNRPTWAYAPNTEIVKKFYNDEVVGYLNATRVQPGREIVMAAAAAASESSPIAKPIRYDPNAV